MEVFQRKWGACTSKRAQVAKAKYREAAAAGKDLNDVKINIMMTAADKDGFPELHCKVTQEEAFDDTIEDKRFFVLLDTFKVDIGDPQKLKKQTVQRKSADGQMHKRCYVDYDVTLERKAS